MPPCFSIVTPSFRQLEYVKRCSASVADQVGDFSVEHLIQDGGTGAEFDAWAAEQSFADCRSERDHGMYDAINKGFARAQGDIIAWLNCDEQYLPGALAKVAVWFETNPDKDILFGDVVLISPDCQPLAYRQAIAPMRGHIQSCFLPTYSAATFLRRKVIDQGHWLDTRYRAIADAVWIDALLGAGFRCGVLNEPLAVFTQTGENLGQSDVSLREGEDWKKACRAGGSFRHLLWSTWHRLRKLVHGGYHTRKVEVNVYLEPEGDRVMRQGNVGGQWKTWSKPG